MTKTSPRKAFAFLVPFALAAVMLLAPVARAELAEVYRVWGAGPVQMLMLPEEERRWSQITDDAEAEGFIRLFWAQRDPSLGTDLNEFRREFEQRVAFADHQFEGEGKVGSLTDRGMVFVLLGPPERIQRPGAAGSSTGGDFGTGDSVFDTGGSITSGGGPGSFGRGGDTDRAGVSSEERWVYEDDKVPGFISRKRFTIRFLSKAGTDEWELRSGESALGWMGTAKREARLHPELTLADIGPSAETAGGALAAGGDDGPMAWMGEEVTGSDASLTALRTALGGGNGGGGGAVYLDAGAFQAGDGRWIIPYQVAARGDAGGGPAHVVGELVDGTGNTVMGFRLEQTWRQSREQRYVKDTLVVPPGDYELRAGLESGGGVSWAASEKVSVPAAAESFWLSEVVVSDSVFPMQEAQQMLEPYAWQGIAVVPKGDKTFAQGSVMWFYLHACYPQLDAEGNPKLRVTVKVEGPQSFRGPAPMTPARAGDHCWVLAQGLDVTPDRFPPGDYEMTVNVRDSTAEETLSTKGSFSVVGAGG